VQTELLTEEQYAQQLKSLGHRVHVSDGVWWQSIYPFYCKPAFVFRAVSPGSARPRLRHSLLGYSHQVPSEREGNRHVSYMVLADELRSFSLSSIKSVKRNQVRRGLELCEIRQIVEIEPFLERIRQINVSQAIRQESRFGAETPATRYIDKADRWRLQVIREFRLGDREWWAASVEGMIAAYMVTYQVETVRIIEKVKSDTEYLKSYPVDALYFTVLEAAAKERTCELVVNGQPLHRSLDHYKEQFLFKAKQYPYFSSHAGLIELCKRHAPNSRRPPH